MADAGSSIFNKNASEKLRSPDDLDKFVRVANPDVWMVLLACLAVLIGLLAWGVFGTTVTSVTCIGTRVDDQVVCFLPPEKAKEVSMDDTAVVEGRDMKVVSISAIPESREEARQLVGSDYLVETLFDGNWAYTVQLSGDISDFATGIPLNVSIAVERMAPISLILGSAQ